MTIEILMPALSPTMEEGTLAKWLVNEGDSINKGDTLCIIEAMKIMNEIESEENGEIQKILVEDGQAIEFNQPLFLINPK